MDKIIKPLWRIYDINTTAFSGVINFTVSSPKKGLYIIIWDNRFLGNVRIVDFPGKCGQTGEMSALCPLLVGPKQLCCSLGVWRMCSCCKSTWEITFSSRAALPERNVCLTNSLLVACLPKNRRAVPRERDVSLRARGLERRFNQRTPASKESDPALAYCSPEFVGNCRDSYERWAIEELKKTLLHI